MRLLSQTLIVHMIRTRKIPFLQSNASFLVMLLTSIIIVIGIVLPFTPIGHSIGMVSLPPVYFLWLAGILSSYFLLMQIVKTVYIRHFIK